MESQIRFNALLNCETEGKIAICIACSMLGYCFVVCTLFITLFDVINLGS